ncbi:MAG: hypothetical protein VX519_04690, partial [Myxococcota bacterium]|nr:hypothetical protein [Myxococcota bacterium]
SNEWSHGHAMAFPADDVHLYTFEKDGIEHLQVSSCSRTDGSQVLFGNNTDYQAPATSAVVQATEYLDASTGSITAIPLPNSDGCAGFHTHNGPSDYYPWLVTTERNPGLLNYFYMMGSQLHTETLHPDYFNIPIPDLRDIAITFQHNTRAQALTSAAGGGSFQLYAYQYPWSNSVYEYIYGTTIEQVDVTASSNAEVVACGIDDADTPHLYYWDPYMGTGIQSYPLMPPTSTNLWDECAITTSASGTLTVALLSGTTLYLGAIDLP